MMPMATALELPLLCDAPALAPLPAPPAPLAESVRFKRLVTGASVVGSGAAFVYGAAVVAAVSDDVSVVAVVAVVVVAVIEVAVDVVDVVDVDVDVVVVVVKHPSASEGTRMPVKRGL